MSPKAKSAAFQSNHDIAIHVPDLKRAEEFYSGVLQFQLISRRKDQLQFDTGAFHLWINLDDAPRSFVPSFDVADAAAAVRQLKAAGCKMVSTGAALYFEDPFGFVFDVIER